MIIINIQLKKEEKAPKYQKKFKPSCIINITD